MDIALLKKIGSIRSFGTDETIIQQGETGEDMFILLKGKVEVVINSEFVGNELKITELETGDIFGEMSMIEDKARSATIRAIEDCTVLRIHRDRFSDFITKDSTVAVKMLTILSNRLVDVRQLINEKAQIDDTDKAEARKSST